MAAKPAHNGGRELSKSSTSSAVPYIPHNTSNRNVTEDGVERELENQHRRGRLGYGLKSMIAGREGDRGQDWRQQRVWIATVSKTVVGAFKFIEKNIKRATVSDQSRN